jgi:cation diffusion facilitator family transporter
MSSSGSKRVVIAALAGNLAIAACKLAAAWASHSSSTLAEAVHSLADTGNQALLLVGMRLAARPASDRFPFGRASERYFWPFVVALLLVSVGGAFAIFVGIEHLVNPSTGESGLVWSYIVLVVSLIFEGMSFQVALKEFRQLTGGKPIRRALFETRDPTVPLVLAEDTTAIVGLLLALLAVGLSSLTGHDFWDAIGSILIGILLCGVALVLAWVTHGLLIGESASTEDRRRAAEITESVDGVERVTQLLSMHLGPEVVILAMKVAFRPGMQLEQVEETTNALEAKIRAAMPHMRKIFVEADSRGDGRGLPPHPRAEARELSSGADRGAR